MEKWRGRMMERCRDEGRGCRDQASPIPRPGAGGCLHALWPATVGEDTPAPGDSARKGRQRQRSGGTRSETLHFT